MPGRSSPRSLPLFEFINKIFQFLGFLIVIAGALLLALASVGGQHAVCIEGVERPIGHPQQRHPFRLDLAGARVGHERFHICIARDHGHRPTEIQHGRQGPVLGIARMWVWTEVVRIHFQRSVVDRGALPGHV